MSSRSASAATAAAAAAAAAASAVTSDMDKMTRRSAQEHDRVFSKSVASTTKEKQLLNRHTDFQAVLLCGMGRTLFPLAEDPSMPKALLPIAGKPMIRHALDSLELAGITDVIILTNKDDETAIQKYLDEMYSEASRFEEGSGTASATSAATSTDSAADGGSATGAAGTVSAGAVGLSVSSSNVGAVSASNPSGLSTSVRAVDNHQRQGTADALREIASEIKRDFIVVSCDFISDFPLLRILDEQRAHNPTITALFARAMRSEPAPSAGGGGGGGGSSASAAAQAAASAGSVGVGIDGGAYIALDSADSSRLVALKQSEDIKADGNGFKLSMNLLHKFPRLTMRRDTSDVHVYACKRWIINLIMKNSTLHSIKDDVIPLLVKMQSSSKLRAKYGVEDGSLSGPSSNAEELTSNNGFGGLMEKMVNPMDYSSSASHSTYAYASAIPGSSAPEREPVWCRAIVIDQSTTTGTLRANTVAAYREANQVATRWLPADVRVAPSAEVSQRTTIGQDSMVGRATKISERCSIKKSIVGPHCVLGKGVKISNSVIMNHVTIEDGVVLNNCVVCANAKIMTKSTLTDCDVATGTVVAQGKPADVVARGYVKDVSEADLREARELAEKSSTSHNDHSAATAANVEQGKLVEEEERESGSVGWAVYKAFGDASGGSMFWALLLFVTISFRMSTVLQDWWLRIWSSSYDTSTNASIDSDGAVVSFTALFSPEPALPAHSLYYYLSWFVFFGLIKIAVSVITQYFTLWSSINLIRTVHAALLRRLVNATPRFFDRTPLGRVISRFSSDMKALDQDAMHWMIGTLSVTISAILICAVISTTVPSFVVPGILVSLSGYFIMVYYLNASREIKRIESVSNAPLLSLYGELTSGVTTIRAYGVVSRFCAEGDKYVDGYNRAFYMTWAANRWLCFLMDVLGASVSLVSALLILYNAEDYTAASAGFTLSYALSFSQTALRVVRFCGELEMNMNSMERIEQYMKVEQEAPGIIPNCRPPASWPHQGEVVVRDLHARYAPEAPQVIKGISFNTRPGERIGIVGRTGAGKSSLGLLLLRMLEADSDTDDSLPATKPATSVELRNSAVFTSLNAPVQEGGSNLSVGQRQLVALARALARSPRVLLLDEASSNVDFETDAKIQATIRESFASSTLLTVAHRLRTVIDYDRILVLEKGQVAEFDTPASLIDRDGSIFRSMCQQTGEFDTLRDIAHSKAASH
ncbi:hypothetical protein GQ42DRAFT_176544 [Ramicandelaber brevisporus]|nr:hypothetical protein GQ42DRAFT_176544 [Ramicandelaber brevisporus]